MVRGGRESKGDVAHLAVLDHSVFIKKNAPSQAVTQIEF